MSAPQASQRLDKWLWAARFFKTRTQAQDAVKGGKVHVDGSRVKPAHSIRVGQQLDITRGAIVFAVSVLELSDQRGPAAKAMTLYAESEQSRARREAAAAARRERHEIRDAHGGRPNKRTRRVLSEIKRG